MYQKKNIITLLLICALFMLFNRAIAQQSTSSEAPVDSTAKQGNTILIDPATLTDFDSLQSLWDITR
jgi:hypothetical protein